MTPFPTGPAGPGPKGPAGPGPSGPATPHGPQPNGPPAPAPTQSDDAIFATVDYLYADLARPHKPRPPSRPPKKPANTKPIHLQSPARRDLTPTSVRTVAKTGGPVQATRPTSGEEPTPGLAVATATAACGSSDLAGFGAGAVSGRDGKAATASSRSGNTPWSLRTPPPPVLGSVLDLLPALLLFALLASGPARLAIEFAST